LYLSNDDTEQEAHDQARELNGFLAGIEKRAFRIARLAVGNNEDALDIVQDAMLSLSQHYADCNCEEWKPLFYKILENRILDFHRREILRKKWFWWKSDPDEPPVPEGAMQGEESNHPLEALQQAQLSEKLLAAIGNLPVKQQQCFLLRSWEGLSVKETATAMGVGEGSIKTHYFRALQKLQTVVASHEAQ
jgi:RNA polymerase sigma-70 factor, ECF subfamily